MPRLLSVNVGLPRDVTWNGKTVLASGWQENAALAVSVCVIDIQENIVLKYRMA